MIGYILNRKSPVFWLIFHVLLGLISTITPWVLIAWFYLVLLTSITELFGKTNGTFTPLVFLISYAASFELLSRMSGTSPYLPYELGKYILFALLTFGILKGFRRGFTGWLMLILLLPGIFIDEAGQTTLKNIIFNMVGPINVALAIILFRKQVIYEPDFINILKFLFYPLISVLSFVIIKTPDLDAVEFTLSANFETAGGFGTNQVSTALGLGAFLAFLSWRYRWKFSGYRWLDLVMFILFFFRGLVTFSRGGMMGGALGILVVLFLSKTISGEKLIIKPVKTFLTAVPVILVLIFVFIYADKKTEGQLLLRYQGETRGTLAGTKEKTLNTFTSNRLQILTDDLKLWKEHPVLGVGVGASSHLRLTSKEFLSHVEVSRLLAEHGIPGLIYVILLLSVGLSLRHYKQYTTHGPVLIALFTIAFFTTFHAAMRTYISPLLIGISLLTVLRDEEVPFEDEGTVETPPVLLN